MDESDMNASHLLAGRPHALRARQASQWQAGLSASQSRHGTIRLPTLACPKGLPVFASEPEAKTCLPTDGSLANRRLAFSS